MKKLITSLAAAAIFAGLSMTSAVAEIKFGLDSAPYPPFADVDASGKRSGFEIELGEAI